MGWDAYAEPVKRLYEWKDGRTGLSDPATEAAFVAAERRVMAACGHCDGFLRQAGLDISDCAEELTRATGEDVYPDGPRIEGKWDWTPETTRRLATEARWTDPEPGREWAQQSARAFLETCAALSLGVRFSW